MHVLPGSHFHHLKAADLGLPPMGGYALGTLFKARWARLATDP